jgi:hypothetical protein
VTAQSPDYFGFVLGAWFVLFGAFVLFQARVPEEKRKFLFGLKRTPAGTATCLGFGTFFMTVGTLFALEEIRVIHIPAHYLIFGLIPFSILIGCVVRDRSIKRKYNA